MRIFACTVSEENLPASILVHINQGEEALLLLTLTRNDTSPQGTFGLLEGPCLSLHTAELPWRDNRRRESCIPTGLYLCRPYSSPRFPDVYEVTGVPGRSAILFHSGNFAGDRFKGYKSDVDGCILPGSGRGLLQGQMAVTGSLQAMDRLRTYLGKKEFELRVIDDTGFAG